MRPHSMATVATLTALAATVLALLDLFAHGLGLAALHLAVGLAVFGAVRVCVGWALNPDPLPNPYDNASESSP
ncbi:hypothetical protein [Streptomyces sp. H10-C2]|uniref:hypothetical protein n=1 Tax=Streptomyces sp. H10-C2 TaxID=3046210 RepID=UPI0024BB603E|nr:hypothetical protein [Streptomyces sp. H10-C2]